MTAPTAPPTTPLARRARAATIGARVIGVIVPWTRPPEDRSDGPSPRHAERIGGRCTPPPHARPDGRWHGRLRVLRVQPPLRDGEERAVLSLLSGASQEV